MTPALLVLSVGGTPEPLIASLVHEQPARVVFVPSVQTRAQVQSILEGARAAGLALSAGQWKVIELADGQDLGRCVRQIREAVEREVLDWLTDPAYRVRVDMTGGTKCMSAALALVAHRWPRCEFSYVGGSERTKDGVGIVVSGREQVVHSQNPWDALGYQAIEDAVLLFNRRNFAGAAQLLEPARNSAGPELKRTFATLLALAQGYHAWDRFEHQKALSDLEQATRNANDLRALFDAAAPALLDTLAEHQAWLRSVETADNICNRPAVLDIIANALRRGEERAFDDAVARLYRAIEAIAQVALQESYGIKTSEVPLDQLPTPLRVTWESRPREGKKGLELGLQDDYKLLHELGDPLAQTFTQLGLGDEKKSPLVARNQSILAHGCQPAGQKIYEQLRQATLSLAGVSEADLPVFPRLGQPV